MRAPKALGLRRKIAEKMAESVRRIPHITYVEEIDMTAVEELRAHLNATRAKDQPKLNVLPFIARAIVVALRDQPTINSHYDDEGGVLTTHNAVHLGIETGVGSRFILSHSVGDMHLFGGSRQLRRMEFTRRQGRTVGLKFARSHLFQSLGADVNGDVPRGVERPHHCVVNQPALPAKIIV